ncbi:hypothetical protein FRC03_004303 [Tulasnella sp. 419]|nr:hypothetical protein FRC03_004303 [Tulasnella sp. 419]
MSSSNTLLNAAGLTPEESKKLTERTPSRDEEKIIKAIRELYSSQPTESTYEIYAPDAVFHDGISYAEGMDCVKAHFNGLPKIFAKTRILRFRVLNNPPNIPESTILIDQDVDYHLSASSASGIKTLTSLLTLERNPQGQVIRHTDEFDHSRSRMADDGFLGKINEARKRLTASVVGSTIDKTPPTN